MDIYGTSDGNFGNQLLRLIFAKAIGRIVDAPDIVTHIEVADLGIEADYQPREGAARLSVPDIYTNLRDVARIVKRLRPSEVCLETVYCDIEFEKHLDLVADLLDPAPFKNEYVGDDYITVNVRAGDIMKPHVHAGYGPLPIAYYRYIIEKSGKTPVFVGEIHDSAYGDLIRKTFPDALYPERRSPLEDFYFLMNSAHISVSISTFSWLGARLSNAKSIHVPFAGFFDPKNWPHQNFCYSADRRISYHALPADYWPNRYERYAQADGMAFARIGDARMAMLKARSWPRLAYYRYRAARGLHKAMTAR